MKKILLLLSIFILTFTSCSDDEIVEQKEEQKEETEASTDTATLELVLGGRSSYENIYASLRIGENNNILEALEKVNASGEKKFDVKKYIGKELVVKIHEKEGDIKPILEGTTKKLTIKKGVNKIVINIPAKKVYAANITVLKGKKAQKGVRVYAVDDVSSIILGTVKTFGSNVLDKFKNTVTNANGVAKFTNLKKSAITSRYHFVVITREANSWQGISGEYKEVVLTLDGTIKNGTIEIPAEKVYGANITVIKEGKPQKGVKIYAINSKYSEEYLPQIKKFGSKILAFFENKPTEANGVAKFPDLNISDSKEYHFVVVTEEPKGNVAGKYKEVVLSLSEGKNNGTIKMDTLLGKLKLVSSSKNPYTITLFLENGKTDSFIVNGRGTKVIELPVGEVKIHVKQNSGYLLYPTEKDYQEIVKEEETVTVYFPD